MSVLLQTLLEEHTIAAAPELVQREAEHAVRCLACAHRCLVRPGRAGVCKVRFNREGELRAPGGYVAGLQADPIEKKPFYHAFPGRDALSFGMLGCDLHCAYCQNWVSSQVLRDAKAVAYPRYCEADQVVQMALDTGAPVVVSTYNEPLITADWAMQIFTRARAKGLVCGFVSNGNATLEVLEYLRPCVDLYKVDLKCFNDRNYRKLGGKLSTVLETISRLKEMGFWVEVVTLLVPGFNDSEEELAEIARFLAGVSTEIPWHVTAFHPDYKMAEPPRTRAEQLEAAYQSGKAAGLDFVYAGNLPGAVGDRENTYCPKCKTLLIRREGFMVLENRMKGETCPACGVSIPGCWESAPPPSRRTAARPRALDW
jgi:pyruvate formate lyase activating enzyme